MILAGYTREMDSLLDANLGMRSRFSTRIEFEDYSDADLQLIYRSMVKGAGYTLDVDADGVVADVIAQAPRGRDWGNARSVRIMVEAACEACDVRIDAAGVDGFTGAQLVELTAEDVRIGAAKAASGTARTDGAGTRGSVVAGAVADDEDVVDAEVIEDDDPDDDWLAEAFSAAGDDGVRGAA